MLKHNHTIIHTCFRHLLSGVAALMVLGMTLVIAPTTVHAQDNTPQAGTTIGNQASATYIDNGGNEHSVTSNTVQTIVQQVASFDLTPGLSKTVSPGGQVAYPHTITNTGNGTDSFSLTKINNSSDDFDFNSISIYADANGDGAPDDFNSPITTTPNIGPGQSYSFVIVANVPSSATNNQTASLDLTTTSNFDQTATQTATDEAVVSENAVIDVIKSFSKNNANPGETITVTLKYSNNGNADGTNLQITDPLPNGLTYVPGSGKWSSAPGATLTDADDQEANASGITYQESGNKVIATISNVAAGQSGTLKFDVTVDNGTEGQTINNTATYNHTDLNNEKNTNTATVTINQSYNVVFGDDGQGNPVPQDIVKNSANQGNVLNFVNTFKNNGTTTDRFNITLANSNYPEGTTFKLYKSDGSGNPTSPLTDTNGDGVPDSGPVAVDNNFEIILQVSLPAGASGDNNGQGYSIDKTATSVNDPSRTSTHKDKLNSIQSNSVDLTNDDYSGQTNAKGSGAYENGDKGVRSQKTTDPGKKVTFDLFITNTGPQNDSYNLAVDQDDDFSSVSIPSGWSVTFRDPDNGNSVISNTGTISSQGHKEVLAEVTIPDGQAAGAQDIYFRASSPTSTAGDIIHDAVTVNEVHEISLVTNQTGQITPGASKTYQHTLTNEGNVTLNDGQNSNLQLKMTNSESNGFTAVVYIDENGDGEIQSGSNGDKLVASADGNLVDLSSVGSLNYNDQVHLLIKVTAANGVSDQTTNTTTITISDSKDGNVASVNNTDITTVQAGNLVIVKKQSLSENGPFSKTDLEAKPGDVVYYQITATNQGSEKISNVHITDATPSYTHQVGPVTVSGNDGDNNIDNDPGDGSTGTIKISANEMKSSASLTIKFAVKIDDGNGSNNKVTEEGSQQPKPGEGAGEGGSHEGESGEGGQGEGGESGM